MSPHALRPLGPLTLAALAIPASSQQILLELDGDQAEGRYGVSLDGGADIDGDGFDDLLIGQKDFVQAHEHGEGRAEVRSGRTGALLYEFLPAPGENEELGDQVRFVGDLDGDGVREIAVAAPRRDTAFSDHAGVVDVFSGASGALLHELFHPSPTANDGLGDDIRVLGDLDGDGVTEIVVGASLADPGGIGANGRVDVYSGATGALLFDLEGESVFHMLGWALAPVGDLDLDGVPDLVASEPGYPHLFTATGRVRAFSCADESVLLVLASDDAEVFGHDVEGVGDVDFDGVPDFLVTAPWSSPGGRVALHSGADGSELASFESAVFEERLGYHLARLGDWDGDGRAEYAVGAQGSLHVMEADLQELETTILSPPGGSLLYGGRVAGAGDVDRDGYADLLTSDYLADVGGISEAGRVEVWSSWTQTLTSAPKLVSAGAGGSAGLDLDVGVGLAGLPYLVLASSAGTAPGLSLDGKVLPLVPGPLTTFTLESPNAAPWSGTLGLLGGAGRASADLDLPAGSPAALVGLTIWHAALVFGQGVAHASNPAAVLVTP